MRRLGDREMALGLVVVALTTSALIWARWPQALSKPMNAATDSAMHFGRSEWVDIAPETASAPAQGDGASSFRLARCEVTNREFREFVDATGYRTTAEQRGAALTFDPKLRKWMLTPGAHWRRPSGPDSSIAGRDDFPVVQVSWFDAVAYARWRGAELPSVQQWKQAARGGQRDAVYPWGAVERPQNRYRANYWQGWFPDQDMGHDGFSGLAPVGSFPPTGAGLQDLAGNVWEWCADRAQGEERAIRGGSWTSAENYAPGYQIGFERSLPAETAQQDLGFRIVASGPKPTG